MQSTSVFLPGKCHGLPSLVDYSPWGRRIGHDGETEHTHQDAGKQSSLHYGSSRPQDREALSGNAILCELPPGFLSENTACPDRLTWWAPDQSLWLHNSWPRISPAKATVPSLLTPLPSPPWSCTHFCPSFPHLYQTSPSSSSWDPIAGRSDLGFTNLKC